jgi:hypothetical protein
MRILPRGYTMRLFAIALGLLLLSTVAEARPQGRRSPKTAVKRERVKKQRPARRVVAIREQQDDDRKPTPRVVDIPRRQIDDDDVNPRPRRNRQAPQSFGLPWRGHLENPSKLTLRDGAYIRRPWRAYGTRTTVELTKDAIEETLELHPKVHVLAVGDISQEKGGFVSDHHSHQAGRDVDLGLWYKRKPPGYPNAFIDGTEANLDSAAMWTLISKLAGTSTKDGGVWVIFLDYNVQGVIYRWAKDHGVSERKLDRVFQYPHGAYSGTGIVRHYRNHAHHIHVRFKCTRAEAANGCG